MEAKDQPLTSDADTLRADQGSVLIATDFSESSRQAILQGFRTASLSRTTPHVLHVCERSGDMVSIDYGGENLLLTVEKGRSIVAEHVDVMLAQYRSMWGEPGFSIAMSHIAVGKPSKAIVQLAKDLRSSLIVVGTSQRKGVERLLMGSTAERVVREAECPVLVSRALEPAPEAMIEPACPACVAERRRSGGEQIWCAKHRDEQERRHTYHYRDKNARVRENLPLLFPMG